MENNIATKDLGGFRLEAITIPFTHKATMMARLQQLKSAWTNNPGL